MGERYLQSLSYPHEIGERCGSHFLHDVSSVDLQSDLADSQLGGRLLIQKAAHDERQDVSFARREIEITLFKQRHFVPDGAIGSILRNRRPDCAHNVSIAERLGQKVQGAIFDCPHR